MISGTFRAVKSKYLLPIVSPRLDQPITDGNDCNEWYRRLIIKSFSTLLDPDSFCRIIRTGALSWQLIQTETVVLILRLASFLKVKVYSVLSEVWPCLAGYVVYNECHGTCPSCQFRNESLRTNKRNIMQIKIIYNEITYKKNMHT